MEELIYVITGLWMIYSAIHFLILQNNYSWKERSVYQKIVSVSGIFTLSLIMVIYYWDL